jgi:hypothetical protein
MVGIELDSVSYCSRETCQKHIPVRGCTPRPIRKQEQLLGRGLWISLQQDRCRMRWRTDDWTLILRWCAAARRGLGPRLGFQVQGTLKLAQCVIFG